METVKVERIGPATLIDLTEEDLELLANGIPIEFRHPIHDAIIVRAPKA